jgi:hypothetical protein
VRNCTTAHSRIQPQNLRRGDILKKLRPITARSNRRTVGANGASWHLRYHGLLVQSRANSVARGSLCPPAARFYTA